MKHYDLADAPKNTNARLVCDIAFQVMRSVTDTKEVKVRAFPGVLMMPRLYEKCDDVDRAEANYLDERKFVALKRDGLLSE
eukprot:gene11586-4757_t